VACSDSTQVNEAVSYIKEYYVKQFDAINELHPLRKELESYRVNNPTDIDELKRWPDAKLDRYIAILDTIIKTKWMKDRLEVKLLEKGKKVEYLVAGFKGEFIPIKVLITLPYVAPESEEKTVNKVALFLVGKDLFGKPLILNEANQPVRITHVPVDKKK